MKHNYLQSTALALLFFVIAIATNFAVVSIYSMDNNIESLYEKIKTLDSQAPSQEYRHYHNQLIRNNSNIELCVQHLIEDEKKEAYHAIEQEFNIPHTAWQESEPIIQAWKKQRNINNNLLFDKAAEQIDDRTKLLIKKTIYESNIKAPILVTFDHGADSEASVLRTYSNDSRNYNFFKLILTLNFFKLDISQQYATLLHEFSHINTMDNGYKFLAYLSAKELNSSLTMDTFSSSRSCKKLSCSFERGADRLPACRSLYNARAMESLFLKLSHEPDNNDGDHPPMKERYDWALRILKFKQAEHNTLRGRVNYLVSVGNKILKHCIK